jgi:CPA1 family monovalent cation:H+ antiporter
MSVIDSLAVLITLTALFSYANYKFIRLPTTIGVMVIALVTSLVMIAIGRTNPAIGAAAQQFLRKIDFSDALMQGMLSFLLFAGALHIDLTDLSREKWPVGALAIFGVAISTFVFGTAIFYALMWVGQPISFAWSLLFGALISPTDPIAVLGILKSARVSNELEVQIAGESLFNDGIGVVAFLVLRGIALGGHEVGVGHITMLFLEEAVGGVAFGLVIGWLTYLMLKSVDNYQVEMLLTLALVLGGYALASALHTSGPIAIVVAGLLIGNHGREFAMSEKTRQHLDTFWELLDEILNALLFVLIGLEILVLTITREHLAAGALAIPALLLARWISVAIPVGFLSKRTKFTKGSVAIMTWGGLRGGISVALALSLPHGRERDLILAITYLIVVFSIVVQGLTVGRVARWAMKPGHTETRHA